MVKKLMKKCSPSLEAIKEMQIKTTLRYMLKNFKKGINQD
jgi:hypothetical protein